ncbi:MAG: hypothetical protein Q8K63_10410 [Acidimicrobiales bacterium]|nr:hypothetical protein [Acidimicrobiales bacterium]
MSNADDLQRKAEEILSENRFHQRRTPGPFRGVFRWLGDRFDPILGPIGRFFTRIFEIIGDWWAEPLARIVLIVAVIGFAVLVSRLLVRRSAVALGGGRRADDESDDPAELERAADRAQARGDYPEAVRLRFQAGVLGLQRNGKIRRGRSTPTRAIGRQLKLAEFDRLGRTFDEVAYGNRPASAADAEESKRDWERVLVEVGKRA